VELASPNFYAAPFAESCSAANPSLTFASALDDYRQR
jgi:hypothetical protein